MSRSPKAPARSRGPAYLAEDLLRTFSDVFSQMKITPPTLPSFGEQALFEMLSVGFDYTFSESQDADDVLLHEGLRIALYIDTRNAQPRVHVRYCSTLRAMKAGGRENRYVAKLPNQHGFLLQLRQGRQARVQLQVCLNCMDIEQRQADANAQARNQRPTALSNAAVIASIVADFSEGEQYPGTAITQLAKSLSQERRLSIASLSRGNGITNFSVQTFDQDPDYVLNAAAVARLTREAYVTRDQIFLGYLAQSGAVNEHKVIAIYRSKPDADTALQHFHRKSWSPDHLIVVEQGIHGRIAYLQQQ